MRNRKRTHEEFVELMYETLGDEYTVVSEYGGARKKVSVRHDKCGKTRTLLANSFLNGSRCFDCYPNKRRLKKTQEEFEKEITGVLGEEYEVVGDYKGTRHRVKVKHKECGLVRNLHPLNYLKGSECPECKEPAEYNFVYRTREDYEEELYEEVGDEYTLIGEYTGMKYHTEMKHNTCGYIWKVEPRNVLQKGTRCPKCTRKGIAIRQIKTQEEFEKEVYEVHKKEYSIIGEYKGSVNKVRIKHNTCGNEFEALPSSIKSGSGCPECYAKEQSCRYRRTHEEYVEQVYELVGDEYTVLSKYKISHQKVKMRHEVCGFEWYVRAQAFITYGSRCHKCRETLGEEKVRRYLEYVGLPHKGEVIFKDLKYKGYLRYDFGIYNDVKEYIALIEYDGEHHFSQIDYFGKDSYKETKIRDELKNKYARDNNIPLLRIPYTEKDIIEEVVEEFLQEIGIHEEELN